MAKGDIKDILLGDEPIEMIHTVPDQELLKFGVVLFISIFGSIILANLFLKALK